MTDNVITEYQNLLTVHQRLNAQGMPLVTGSEVRLPDGSHLPHVVSVTMHAQAGEATWLTTIVVRAKMGEVIGPDEPVR